MRRLGNRQKWLVLSIATCLAMAFTGLASAREVQKLQTESGIGIWLVEDHGVPIVSVAFAMRGGSVLDPPGLSGLGHITANALLEGAGDLDAQAFNGELEALGTRLSFAISRRALTGGLVTLSKNRERSFELLGLALREPRFDTEAFQHLIEQEKASLDFESRRVEQVAVQRFFALAFDGHPYAQPVKGTSSTLENFTRDDAKRHLSELVGTRDLHVVVVGAIGAAEAQQQVERLFMGLPKGKERTGIDRSPLKPVQALQPSPGGQSLETAVIALPMPGLGTNDFYAGLALNHIIGSGNFDARLTREVRVKRGLTYAIGTTMFADDVASYVLGVFSTGPGKMDEANSVINDVFVELGRSGPTRAELRNAVSQLVGNYVLSLTTSGKIANHLIGLWLDGLPPDYGDLRQDRLKALKPEDLRRVAERYLDPSQVRMLVLTPAAAAGR